MEMAEGPPVDGGMGRVLSSIGHQGNMTSGEGGGGNQLQAGVESNVLQSLQADPKGPPLIPVVTAGANTIFGMSLTGLDKITNEGVSKVFNLPVGPLGAGGIGVINLGKSYMGGGKGQ